jgi:hypothetical protein
MRTTAGSQRVDVIYRRVDDAFLDPLANSKACVNHSVSNALLVEKGSGRGRRLTVGWS